MQANDTPSIWQHLTGKAAWPAIAILLVAGLFIPPLFWIAELWIIAILATWIVRWIGRNRGTA
jgi:hypothetical protein